MHNFTDSHGPAGSAQGNSNHMHSEQYIRHMLLARYRVEAGELARAQNELALANAHRKVCGADPMARRDFVKLPRWAGESKVWRAVVTGEIDRLELEHILNSPHFGLNRADYISCLLTADDLKFEGINA